MGIPDCVVTDADSYTIPCIEELLKWCSYQFRDIIILKVDTIASKFVYSGRKRVNVEIKFCRAKEKQISLVFPLVCHGLKLLECVTSSNLHPSKYTEKCSTASITANDSFSVAVYFVCAGVISEKSRPQASLPLPQSVKIIHLCLC